MRAKFKRDQFRRSRGGTSKLLDISCSKCGAHVCFYQKDGPGMLKRMYLDRIIGITKFEKNLTCLNCAQIIGTEMVYEKENRAAYRLQIGAITKRGRELKKLS